MCDVVRRFLDSVVELKGNEYVKRAITYISTFIPEGKRNEMELLDFLYQLNFWYLSKENTYCFTHFESIQQTGTDI